MILILLAVFLATTLYVYYKNRKIYAAGDKFPGPRALPLLGNSYDFATNSRGIFLKLSEFSQKYDRFFRIWNNRKLFLLCHDPKDVEVLLGSNKYLRKIDLYRFFYPWIGDGLISTSVIDLWRTHRKILTPTFHFKILHEFLEVFNRNSQILCDQLESRVGKGPFDASKYIKLAALDNISETAMGVNMNAQINSGSDYVKAVTEITNIVSMRLFKVWLMIDFIFNLTKHAQTQRKALKIIHGTTNKIIQERREALKGNRGKDENATNDEETFYKKRKLAFLDLLLESEEGSQLTDKEIRDEVSTFMFAGHDTISSLMSFTVHCLAENPDVQERAYEEQISIFGDSKRVATYDEIQEMKYLEQVLKESARLYPTIPLIGRELTDDLTLPGECHVPKGTQMVVNIFALHRNPKVWPNPEKFNPDNFSPEAAHLRNPYAFVPFSAGPRNCLGQKFAVLEMKSTISKILRHYKIIKSPYPEHELKLVSEVTLFSSTGIHVQIERRF